MMKKHTTAKAMTEYTNANLQYRECVRVGTRVLISP